MAQRDLLDAQRHCRNCGCEIEPPEDSVIRRGSIVVLQAPVRILWRNHLVPLSPTEALMVALVVRRGRASFAAIDDAMRDYGSNPATRSVLLWRIRRKFAAMGAAVPFESVANVGVRFVIEADEEGVMSTVIGLRRA